MGIVGRVYCYIPGFVIFCMIPSLASIKCVRTIKTSTWWDEHLTSDNADFVKKDVTEEYNALTKARLSPLKDEPWPRHEWMESESNMNPMTTGNTHLQ